MTKKPCKVFTEKCYGHKECLATLATEEEHLQSLKDQFIKEVAEYSKINDIATKDLIKIFKDLKI